MLLDYQPQLVRLILRIYFNVVFIVLAVIGNQCVLYSTKLNILRKKRVNVTRMTGWLGSFEPFLTCLSMRRIPGGWLGALMMISVALSYISDIAVSALIKQVRVSARCPFTTGLVPPTNEPLALVPVNGSPYTVVSTAQLSSLANGGPIGIYSKVNLDRNFQAQTEDIVGRWNCNDVEDDQVYELGASKADITQDLRSRGLLFDTTAISEAAGLNKSFGHFVVMTSSQSDDAQQPFDVRASVQLEARYDDTKTMKSFDCNMDAPSMEWVLTNMSSQSTLQEWILTFQGSMYNGTGTTAASDCDVRLSWILNSMIMIGAGGNYLLGSAPLGSTQGCLAQRADIPNTVLGIFGIITLILILLFLYLFALLLQYLGCPSSQRSALKYTTNGLVDWMAHAAHASLSAEQNDANKDVESKELKRWGYGLRGGSVRPRLFRKRVGGSEFLVGSDNDHAIGLMNLGDMKRTGSLEGMIGCVMFDDLLSCTELSMKTMHRYLG